MVDVQAIKDGLSMLLATEATLQRKGDSDGTAMYSSLLSWWILRGVGFDGAGYRTITEDQAIALGVMIADICSDCEEVVGYSIFDCAEAVLANRHGIKLTKLIAYGTDRAAFAKVIGWLVEEERALISGVKYPKWHDLQEFLQDEGLVEPQPVQLPKE